MHFMYNQREFSGIFANIQSLYFHLTETVNDEAEIKMRVSLSLYNAIVKQNNYPVTMSNE